MKIAIMLPGNAYTYNFFKSWTKLIADFTAKGVNFTVHNIYSPVVYQGRNMMLLAGQEGNTGAIPLNGKEYDYMLWLETDMVFEPEDVWKLIEVDKDIVSGAYPMGTAAPDIVVAGNDDKGRLTMSGLRKLNEVQGQTLVPIDFCGLGFVLVKQGVFEKLKYPWFWEMYAEPDDAGNIEYLGDDFSFCNHVKKAGYVIYLHSGVMLGHEKTWVVR